VPERSRDWFRQAEADLDHARLSLAGGDFEWGCFAAQQAAEKALKAVFFSHHGDPWGHSLLAMVKALPEAVAPALTQELLDAAKVLDKHYLPTRYPNGFDAGAPVDYYTEREARDAIALSESVLAFSRAHLR